MEDIMNVGLPTLVEAIKAGTYNELHRKQPEFFLCELKNKQDRYEITKLSDKTRPYVTMPAHLQFPCSVLSQRFQMGLSTFNKDPASSNAYGFSGARGGLTEHYQWMLSVSEGELKKCGYGDDTNMVTRREGKVYRCDPDFKQMDGSIDKEDVGIIVDWVLHSLAKEDGIEVPKFWKIIGEYWKMLAVDPDFLVNGTTVYAKARPTGLMTGVTGTTLFDTVKSLVSWEMYTDYCSMTAKDFMDGGVAQVFMREYSGLVIKEGTWKWSEVPQDFTHGTLITDHKFLGLQMLMVETPTGEVVVPTLDDRDAINNLVVQKDNPFETRASRLSKDRLLFDRARGLYITFGFSNPIIRNAIHHIVNNIPPEAILIQVQNAGGEGPDHIMLEGFQYPDSTGFPSIEFCLDLYRPTEVRAGWTQIYPTLKGQLDQIKLQARTSMRIKDNVIEELPKPAPHVTEIPIPVLDRKRPVPPLKVKPNSRSEIIGRKNLPDFPESLHNLLQEGLVLRIGEVCDKFGVTPSAVQKAVVKIGASVSGATSQDLVSLRPFRTPEGTIQEVLSAQTDRLSGDKHEKLRTTPGKVRSIQEEIDTSPLYLSLNKPLVEQLVPGVEEKELMAGLNRLLQNNNLQPDWVEHPDRVVLSVKEGGKESSKMFLASARALTFKLAREYIAHAILDQKGMWHSETLHSLKKANSWAEEVLQGRYEQGEVPKDPIEDQVEEVSLKLEEKGYPRILSVPYLYNNWGHPQLVEQLLQRALIEERARKRNLKTSRKRKSKPLKTLKRANDGVLETTDCRTTEETSETRDQWPQHQEQQQQLSRPPSPYLEEAAAW